MNSAHQVQTLEISEAELDNVSGGLSPEASVVAGSTTLSSAGLLSQLDAVKGEALGTLGQFHQVGVSASF
ncbi:hypothetical protein J2Z21_007850 [Streptomyces griseochromogenes]|uniref:Type A2 lantipeptide n=1 Tax=Streptomyces griseochromogenes TaxID=68214 RepID=A0A1B1BAL8_9ACTN|nr:hypothetical protein [Streptomyces griseochromogenes]ANP55876.1 hypothetical protein AVL59_45325 [Streptomyces griseochromogenes]MBP2054840.1 hypothetical protein [Streptomyces griseochromogenes]